MYCSVQYTQIVFNPLDLVECSLEGTDLNTSTHTHTRTLSDCNKHTFSNETADGSATQDL